MTGIKASSRILAIVLALFPLIPDILANELPPRDMFDFNEIEPVEKQTRLPVSGRLTWEMSRQPDCPDRWIRLGPYLNLIFDHTAEPGQLYFEGTGRINFSHRLENDSEKIRKKHETEFIPREIFWKRDFGRYTLSVGKIIDDRTVMDLLQVADKISIMNRGDTFFADPRDVKLGQNMIRLEYFSAGQTDAGIIFTPYPSYDRIMENDHPYAVLKNRELLKSGSNRDMEGSFFLTRPFSKGRVSIFGGRFNNRMPLLKITPVSGGDSAYKHYSPFWSLGMAFNMAVEPFLLKTEMALNIDKALQTQEAGIVSGSTESDQMEIAAGTDINLGKSGTLVLEGLAVLPLERNDIIHTNRTSYWGALAWSNTYMGDKLRFNITTFFPDSLKNMINRFQSDYFLTDNLSVTARYTRFAVTGKEYIHMDRWDRLDISINYDFSLE